MVFVFFPHVCGLCVRAHVALLLSLRDCFASSSFPASAFECASALHAFCFTIGFAVCVCFVCSYLV